MRRAITTVLLAATGLGVAGCVGDTDPASRITAGRAQLNAHGRTDNGPARWWWEYATSESAVQNDQGRETPRRGPASSPNDVALSETVNGLIPGTVYFFRACGQDVNRTTPACGQIRSFRTAAGDSLATVENAPGGAVSIARFFGHPDVPHNWKALKNGSVISMQENWPVAGNPTLGSSIIGAGGCPNVEPVGIAYEIAVRCTSSLPISRVVASFSNARDIVTVDAFGASSSFDVDTQFDGRAGNDFMFGGARSDRLIGGPGVDELYGQGGDDVLDANVDGSVDTVDCGPGNDTAYVDPGTEESYARSHGCEFIFLP